MLPSMHAATGLVNAMPSVKEVFPMIWWAAPPAGVKQYLLKSEEFPEHTV